ncbi:MAG: hypothetical protein U1F43_02275 [Myxococcota bacterium]
MRAGERDRAVAFAVQKGAFAAALSRLEREKDPRAAALRSAWAESIAATGDVVRALDIYWPLPAAQRPLALPWIERALALGGPSAAAVLPKLLEVAPAREPEALAALAALRDDPDATARGILAERLRQVAPHPRLERLADAAARVLLGDVLRGDLRPELVRDVIQRARFDQSFAADLPPLPRAQRSLGARAAGHRRAVERARAAVRARRRRAAGPAPARRAGRAGRAAARSPRPPPGAHDRARPPARRRRPRPGRGGGGLRGALARIARLDLERRVAIPWQTLPARAVARTFDGRQLILADATSVTALDVHSTPPEATWYVSDLGGPITGLERHPDHLSVAVAPDLHWRFELPSFRFERQGRSADHPMTPLTVTTPLDGKLVAEVVASPPSILVRRVRTVQPALTLASLRFEGAERVDCRLGPILTAFSRDGRVRAVSLTSGEVVGAWTVRL